MTVSSAPVTLTRISKLTAMRNENTNLKGWAVAITALFFVHFHDDYIYIKETRGPAKFRTVTSTLNILQ